jgi:hypothetical protein
MASKRREDYVVTVGKEGFTREEIERALKESLPYKLGKLTMDDWDGLVAYIRERWADFPADKFINETDPEVWLRREELYHCVYGYACRKGVE